MKSFIENIVNCDFDVLSLYVPKGYNKQRLIEWFSLNTIYNKDNYKRTYLITSLISRLCFHNFDYNSYIFIVYLEDDKLMYESQAVNRENESATCKYIWHSYPVYYLFTDNDDIITQKNLITID